MNNYIKNVKDSLKSLISDMAANPSLFVKNPKTDFSRNRKIKFQTFLEITLNSGGCTMNKELLDFFDLNMNTPSVSAYTQQRAKVLPEAFEFLFHEFTAANTKNLKLYEGYRLLACDGSNLSFATNPDDAETVQKNNHKEGVTNHLHLNALYDVMNKIYVDALIQTKSEHHEQRACLQMIERSPLDNVILIADRGYEYYNLFAHAIKKEWKFLIRGKDIGSNGIASDWVSTSNDIFDVDIDIMLTRKQSKAKKKAGYKFMPTNQAFDYLPSGSYEDYPLSFRIVRFKITDDSYETVITNLDRFLFPPEKLKDLYHLRWGIETSFRELKYAIGLTSFHSKKSDYVKQEIYARLTLYNYCELITMHVVKHIKKETKKYQVNFTVAIYICREYLRNKRRLRPPDVAKLIEKYTLPVRPGRKDPRKVKVQATVSFLYRVA